ncbi:MAG: hypothetical protein HQK77_10335 [Desulfobacterales bacterium]|nr:hypothetical protein [Desulfobacterales bacterium]
MAKNDEFSLTQELDEALEDFFSEEDSKAMLDKKTASAKTSTKKNKTVAKADDEESVLSLDQSSQLDVSGANLEKIKAIVLQLEWEITDETMESFIAEVEALTQIYKGDDHALPLLKVLDTLSRYVNKNKVKSHPEAIKCLRSVFDALEKIFTTKGMADKQRKSIVDTELERYNSLKNQLTEKAPKATSNIERIAKVSGTVSAKELKQFLVDEIRKAIQEEFQKIRKELSNH